MSLSPGPLSAVGHKALAKREIIENISCRAEPPSAHLPPIHTTQTQPHTHTYRRRTFRPTVKSKQKTSLRAISPQAECLFGLVLAVCHSRRMIYYSRMQIFVPYHAHTHTHPAHSQTLIPIDIDIHRCIFICISFSLCVLRYLYAPPPFFTNCNFLSYANTPQITSLGRRDFFLYLC